MANKQKNPHLDPLSAEFTDGAETGEFDTNEPLEQNRTGWDSSRYNENPAGPLTEAGEGRSGQASDPTQDYADQTQGYAEHNEGEDYDVSTAWPSGSRNSPDYDGPNFTDRYDEPISEPGEPISLNAGKEVTNDSTNNRWQNQRHNEVERAEGYYVATHSGPEDDDDMDEDDEEEALDDLDMDDELSSEYDDELGNTPKKDYWITKPNKYAEM